jgi:uncharacterized membrane protein SirB2
MLLVRHLHILLAYVTLASFAVRGVLSLLESPVLRERWVRTVPHVIDTLLLVFGVTLAIHYRMSPLVHHWLGVKILMLFVYIGLGIVAMRARRRPIKLAALVGAVASILFIIAVARARQPFPF